MMSLFLWPSTQPPVKLHVGRHLLLKCSVLARQTLSSPSVSNMLLCLGVKKENLFSSTNLLGI